MRWPRWRRGRHPAGHHSRLTGEPVPFRAGARPDWGRRAMILDLFRVTGRVAVVTGAGRGLGAAAAVALAQAGEEVPAGAGADDQGTGPRAEGAPRIPASAVINISSAVGRTAGRGYLAYGTAKAALAHYTRLAAADLAPRVRVNAIAVGAAATSALDRSEERRVGK